MAGSHAQYFANEILPRAVFSDPLALTRALASGSAGPMFAELWEQAGAQVGPASRIDGSALAGTIDKRASGVYTTASITPPPPRETGDPALITFVGRGDGAHKLATIAYYVLEAVLEPGPAPQFTVVSRTDRERVAVWADGPLPDPRWLADHTFELYCGRVPGPAAGVPELPGWYFWYAFEGANALREFQAALSDGERGEIIRKSPILLLPDIADTAEQLVAGDIARRLRDFRGKVRKGPAFEGAWKGLVERLARASVGSPPANNLRLLPIIAEARQSGSVSRGQAYELEGTVRENLASLGVDAETNHDLAGQLFAAARATADAERAAAEAARKPVHVQRPPTEEELWRPLFLDATELPDHAPTEYDESVPSHEPAFVALGGLRAGFVAWVADESAAMARVVDSRWVLRTNTAAATFARALAAVLAEGLPTLGARELGDETFTFGDDGTTGGPRAFALVVRVGRMVAKLQALEGPRALESRRILHAAMLDPLAVRVVQRMRNGLGAYWLAVAQPTNAVPALVHAPGYNAAALLDKYPLLALPDLPAAMATLGESHLAAANALAMFQANLRAHRWAMYRDAMLAVVRALLAADVGDSRVNVAHAHEIVLELAALDSNPVWAQLDAECRARS